MTDSDSNPMEGATVSLMIGDVIFEATTDGDGTYTIWNVPADEGITVTADAQGYQQSSTEVTINEGQQTKEVDFTLSDE